MDPASITQATVRLIAPGAVAVAQAAGSPSLDATGLIVTIVPAQSLANDTIYQIQIIGLAGGVKSQQGLNMTDHYQQPTGFRTVGVPPALAISSTTPAAGATGVSPLVHPVVVFTVAVDSTTVTPGTIQLISSDGTAVPQAVGSPALDATGTTVTVTPASPLALSTTYRLQVLGGDSGVRDLTGRLMGTSLTINPGFTTLVGTPPTVTATSPADGATDVSSSAPVTVTFSAAMDPASITAASVRLLGPGAVPVTLAAGSPSLDATGRIATLVPAAKLGWDTVYQIQVIGMTGGAKNSYGTPLDGTYQHSIGFRISPQPAPPNVLSSTPSGGGTGIDLAIRPTVTFSKRMDPASITSGTVTLRTPDGVPVAQAAGSPTLDASGTVATIIPASALKEYTYFKILVLSGDSGVKDTSGVAMTLAYTNDPGFRTLNLPPPNVPNLRRRNKK